MPSDTVTVNVKAKTGDASKKLSDTTKKTKQMDLAVRSASRALQQMNAIALRTRGLNQVSSAFNSIAVAQQKVAFLANPQQQARALGSLVNGMNALGTSAARAMQQQAAAFGSLVNNMNLMARSGAQAIKQVSFLQKGVSFLTSTVGKLSLAFAAVAVFRFGVDAVKAFASAENAMAPVLTLAKFTTQQIEDMEDSTKKLRREFGATADQIGESRFDVISSGFEKINDQTRILEASFKLAKTANSDFGTATETLTSILAAFNLDASQTEIVMDKLKAGGDIAKGTFEQLGPAIARVAPAAVETGKSLDEVIAALSALTLAGIKEEQAANLLSSSFIQLIKPETLKRLKAAGLSLDFNKIKTLELVDVIKALPTDKADELFEILGRQEAFRGISVLARDLSGLEEKIKLVGDSQGLVAGELDEAMNNTQVQLDRLGESWLLLKERIGEALKGSGDAIETLGKVFNVLTDRVIPMIDNMVQSIVALITGSPFEALEKWSRAVESAFGIDFVDTVKSSISILGNVAGLISEGKWTEAGEMAAKLFDQGAKKESSGERFFRGSEAGLRGPGTPAPETGGLTAALTDAQLQANVRLAELRGKDFEAFKLNLEMELTALRKQKVDQKTIRDIESAAIREFGKKQSEDKRKAAEKEIADQKKILQARIDVEREANIRLAELRGDEETAFELGLQNRLNKMNEQGASIQSILLTQAAEREAFEEEQLLKIDEKLNNLEARFGEFGAKLLTTFSGALANSITNVFAALGAGEKIDFKKALGSILSAIGQMAIATGTWVILTGQALQSIPIFGQIVGTSAIVQGLALIAFGGGLTAAGAALSKGGGGGGGGGTSGAQEAARTGDFGSPRGGPGRAGANVGNQIFLSVETLNPAAVDWRDIAENHVGPALVEGGNRGAIDIQTTRDDSSG